MVHCSGGAQTKVLRLCNDDVHIKDNMLPITSSNLFAESGTFAEMYKVFNMGIALEIYFSASEAQVQRVIDAAKSFKPGYRARVEGVALKKLTIESEMGKFTY
jgi:phosphoribosylformylglycinamidine cyclo-ligase